jgi:hypothetical protein
VCEQRKKKSCWKNVEKPLQKALLKNGVTSTELASCAHVLLPTAVPVFLQRSEQD